MLDTLEGIKINGHIESALCVFLEALADAELLLSLSPSHLVSKELQRKLMFLSHSRVTLSRSRRRRSSRMRSEGHQNR